MVNEFSNDFRVIKKVTIVVLAYNNYWNFDRCFKSIINQNYPSIEIILADDGSDIIDKRIVINNVEELVKDKFKVLFLFNSENLGTVKNFNHAIRHATGELIVPLAMDDSLTDKYVIENVVSYFNEKKTLLATSYCCYLRGNSIKFGPTQHEVSIYKDPCKTNEKLFKEGLFIRGANTYYHINVFNEFGLFDEKYKLYEDVPFLYKYLDSGYELNIVPYVCVLYTQESGGVSDMKRINKSLRIDRVLLYDEVLKNKKYHKAYRWIRYLKYRNKYPQKRFIAALLFFDIEVRKAIKKMEGNKWIKCKDDDVKKYIDEFNSLLKNSIQ